MEGAYNIIEVPLVEELAKQMENEGMNSSEAFKFRIDLLYFANYLRTYFNKELEEADEMDLAEYKKFLSQDITFYDLEERRYENAKLALQKLKEAQ